MFEEPTFSEQEEKLIERERMKKPRSSPVGKYCFILFIVGSLLSLSSGHSFDQFEEDWEIFPDWTCSYCGTSNDGEYDSCNACGASR